MVSLGLQGEAISHRIHPDLVPIAVELGILEVFQSDSVGRIELDAEVAPDSVFLRLFSDLALRV